MLKNPKFDVFQREQKIRLIRKELENNDYIWLELLHKKMQISKQCISNYLKTYFKDNLTIKKTGRKKLIKLKNKNILKKEKELYKKVKAILQLQKYRKRGYSYSELSNILKGEFNLHLDIHGIVDYTKHIKLSKEGIKRLKEKIRKDRQKAQKLSFKKQIESGRNNWYKNLKGYDNTKSIKKQPKELTKEKAQLIGHCLFDGYIDLKNYVIAYFSNTKKQVKNFINLIKKIYNLKGEIKTKGQNGYYCRVFSKKAVKDLIKYTPDYSTKSDKKTIVPKEILNGSVKIKRSFLRAFWDDEGAIMYHRSKEEDGYYHLTRKLEAFCENKTVREDLLKLHHSLGIGSRIIRKKIIISGIGKFQKI